MAMTKAQIQAALDADPAYQQYVKTITAQYGASGRGQSRGLLNQYVAQTHPDIAQSLKDAGLNVSPSGQLESNAFDWKSIIIPAAFATGGLALASGAPAAAALGPSATGTTTTAAAVPAALSAVAPAVTTGATTMAGGGLTDLLLKYGLPAATNLISTGIQANASDKATAAQMAYYDKALAAAQEEQQFNRNRYAQFAQTLQPYQASGTAALGTATNALAQARSPVNPYAAAAGEPMVTLRAPDGTTKAVARSQVPHFTALGAVPV